MRTGVCLSVYPSDCSVPQPNSTTERPRKPKISVMEAHHTSKPESIKRSKDQRSRSPGRLMQAETVRHTEISGNSRDAKVKVKAHFIK